MAVFPEQRGYDEQRNHGKQNQQADFPFRGRIRKNAERGAGVFGVDDAKKSGDDRDAVVQGKTVCDRPLCDAIESDDQQRDQEMIFTHEEKISSLVYSLSRLRKPQSRAINFFEHGTAALAHRRVVLVLTDVSREVPTALA